MPLEATADCRELDSSTRKSNAKAAGCTAVLVDDHKSIRVALARLFRSADMRIVAFGSAEEFLESGLLDSAGCLVADVHLPGMSGLELQEVCNKRRPGLAIIVISAFEDDDAEHCARAAGAVAFLHKPFDAAWLLTLVGKTLDRDCGV